MRFQHIHTHMNWTLSLSLTLSLALAVGHAVDVVDRKGSVESKPVCVRNASLFVGY